MVGPSLVTPDWLEPRLDDESVKIVEVHFKKKTRHGLGRIPGALSWYWRDALWDDLPRQFPTPAQMAHRLAGAGISDDTTLVLYSTEAQFAAYGAWVIGDLCGHPDVRILDGGLVRWAAERRPLSPKRSVPTRTTYVPRELPRDDSSRIGLADVRSSIERDDVALVDVRSREEYLGLRVMPPPGLDHGAERAGHIPGASHLPHTDLLQADSSFRGVAEMTAAFRRVGATPDQAERVIIYCRLGHRASLAWYAMTHLLGWGHGRIYDGSWTEWGNTVGLPIER